MADDSQTNARPEVGQKAVRADSTRQLQAAQSLAADFSRWLKRRDPVWISQSQWNDWLKAAVDRYGVAPDFAASVIELALASHCGRLVRDDQAIDFLAKLTSQCVRTQGDTPAVRRRLLQAAVELKLDPQQLVQATLASPGRDALPRRARPWAWLAVVASVAMVLTVVAAPARRWLRSPRLASQIARANVEPDAIASASRFTHPSPGDASRVFGSLPSATATATATANEAILGEQPSRVSEFIATGQGDASGHGDGQANGQANGDGDPSGDVSGETGLETESADASGDRGFDRDSVADHGRDPPDADVPQKEQVKVVQLPAGDSSLADASGQQPLGELQAQSAPGQAMVRNDPVDQRLSWLQSETQDRLRAGEDRGVIARLQRLIDASHLQTLTVVLLHHNESLFDARRAKGAPLLAPRAIPPLEEQLSAPPKTPAPFWSEEACRALRWQPHRVQRLRELDRLSELLQGDVELTPTAARHLGAYLLRDHEGHELREVYRRASALGRSRYLRLSVAEQLEQGQLAEADLKELVERLIMRQITPRGSESLSELLRRRLLQSVMEELPSAATHVLDVSASYEAAGQWLQENYRLQASQLGANLPNDATREPGRTLAELALWAAAAWDAEGVMPWEHRLSAIEAVSSTDLQRTVRLQRLWLEMLELRGEPSQAAAQDFAFIIGTPATADMVLLDQLVEGELSLLRHWMRRLSDERIDDQREGQP